MKNFIGKLTYEHALKNRAYAIRTSGLSDEDQKIIEDIMKRMSIFKVNSRDAISIQDELIGMAKEYNIRQQDFKEAIGTHPKAFADQIIASAYGPSMYEIGLRFISESMRLFIAVALFSSAFLFSSWSWGELPLLVLFFWLLVSVISPLVNWTLGPMYCFEEGYKKWIPFGVLVILWLIVIGLLKAMPLFQVPIPIHGGLLLVISVVLYLICDILILRFMD